MKNIVTILTLVFLFLTSYGQDNKKTLAFEPISIPQGVDYSTYPDQVTKLVNDRFVESNRFVVMPTTDWQIQQGGTSDPYIDVAKQYGVTYLVVGILNSINTATRTALNPNGTLGQAFSAHISVSLKIINTETGSVYSSKTFEIAPFLQMMTTPEAAINGAMNNLSREIKKWIGETFPVTIPVVRIMDQNKRKGAIRILISAGSESGIAAGNGHKKTQLKIVTYASEMLNGTQVSRTIQVGTAEVALIEDKNFTDCIVTSGGFDVERKINEGDKLFVVTLN